MEEVQEATTVGVPDDYLGEKIISYIVLRKDKQITDKDVLEYCKNYLSRDKIPDKVKFVDELPKGPSGKILRREIRGGVK